MKEKSKLWEFMYQELRQRKRNRSSQVVNRECYCDSLCRILRCPSTSIIRQRLIKT